MLESNGIKLKIIIRVMSLLRKALLIPINADGRNYKNLFHVVISMAILLLPENWMIDMSPKVCITHASSLL